MLISFVLAGFILGRYASHEKNSAATSDHEVTKILTECGSLRGSNTRYVLKNNVQSAGTCFSVEADNVTLDLDRHTILYGMSIGSHPTFGVLVADCWSHQMEGNPCGGTHKHPTIMNGKIVQGTGAAPMSHALRFGQANNLTGVTVHDLDITIGSPDSIAIFGEYLPGGSNLYANTIHNNVRTISNRHQFLGASIKLGEEVEAKFPDFIHGNTILGGAQLGIRDDNPAGSKIYENDVSQDATYTNGFCIDAAGAGMQVYQNRCHPLHGRGIHTNQSNVQIFDNVIETVDSGDNAEYEGCEINGTYGIQVESDNFDPTNVSVFGNRVTVHAAQCSAEAMRLTEIKDGTITIHDNIFIAVQDKIGGVFSEKAARAFSVGETHGDNIRIFDNAARADSAIFHMDWDGGGGFTLSCNKFQGGRKGQETLLADFENGVSPSYDNNFVDNIYDGFVPTSARFGPYTGNSWYVVTRSINIRAVDRNDRQVQDPVGIILESDQTTPHQGVYDGQGLLQFAMPILRIENGRSMHHYGPYTLTIHGYGCDAYRSTIPSFKDKNILCVLSCR